MSAITEDIAAFDAMKAELEAEHFGEWVVFHDKVLTGAYPDLETAANDAVARFGRGPYLIRQVGAQPINLPASVVYRPAHAQDAGWL